MLIASVALLPEACAAKTAREGAGQPPAGPAVGIRWDASTLALVRERGNYARMIRLAGGTIICAYDVGGRIFVSRSDDDGRSWHSETPAAAAAHGVATNAELLQLANGWVLLSFNERPNDGLRPYAIKLCISRDGARTWSAPATLYEADALFENGCWEPAQIQLPDGEVQLYFANENPYRQSAEQEISMMRSRDNGLTWTPPQKVIFRAGRRDGMPSPLVLAGGRGIAVAIEDNALGLGFFRPSIAWTPLEVNWRDGPVTGASPRRWLALAGEEAKVVFGGGPMPAPVAVRGDGFVIPEP